MAALALLTMLLHSLFSDWLSATDQPCFSPSVAVWRQTEKHFRVLAEKHGNLHKFLFLCENSFLCPLLFRDTLKETDLSKTCFSCF